jgi:sulfur relay (sulfurtransferase) DsrF/TusC family protein
MNDFFKEVHSKYYNDQDISFMEYFLDLINHNQFYVHHSKLVEYGVMTSTQSTHIRDKLNQFDLIEDEDYG